MNRDTTQITIVLTIHNDAKYLKECWTSIQNQTLKPVEIIVIDDCSTDRQSLAIFEEFKEMVLKNQTSSTITIIENRENIGPAKSRNLGISKTTSKYILCVDVDNKLHALALEKFSSVLDADPDTAIVYSWMQRFGAETYLIKWPEFSYEKLSKQNYIDTCSMFRKSAWEFAGGFETEFQPFEDWQLWVKILKSGRKATLVPLPLLLYRVRMDSFLRTTDGGKRRDVCLKIMELAK